MTAVAVPRLCPFCRLRPLQPWRDPHLHSCAVCAAQAVTRPEQLQSLAQWLLARIAQVTPWSLRRGSTRVRLLDPVAFEQRFGNGVAGLAQQWWLDGRLGRQHQRAEVFLQYGSPAARASCSIEVKGWLARAFSTGAAHSMRKPSIPLSNQKRMIL